MNIVYLVSEDVQATGYKDDRGNDLYSTNIVIIDRDRILNGKYCILDEWQATYPMVDKDYEINQQIESAESIIAKLKKYIQVYELKMEQLVLQEHEKKYKNSGITASHKKANQERLRKIEHKFSELASELITVRCALAFHQRQFCTVNANWISENMVNDRHYVLGEQYLLEEAELQCI